MQKSQKIADQIITRLTNGKNKLTHKKRRLIKQKYRRLFVGLGKNKTRQDNILLIREFNNYAISLGLPADRQDEDKK